MAGIYVHVPFCQQKCHYCDFHFSTDTRYMSRMVDSMIKELSLRSAFLPDQELDTVYFGGGTPSLLPNSELKRLTTSIESIYRLSEAAERTIEANPEDIEADSLEDLSKLGFNRLSIGIQSFMDSVLESMNRAHTAERAMQAIDLAQAAGFNNISVDMIYGWPDSTLKEIGQELEKFKALGVQHISAYALTIEKGTYYGHLQEKGELKMPDPDDIAEQFLLIRDVLQMDGFEQYEISNFSKPGYESRHNSAYWCGSDYLGIGPSAHSFDSNSRYWNVSNNFLYMKAVEQGSNFTESEVLDERTRFNEYILTRLRTKWGLDLGYLKEHFGVDLLHDYQSQLKPYQSAYTILDKHLMLNSEGLLLADRMASDLFFVE